MNDHDPAEQAGFENQHHEEEAPKSHAQEHEEASSSHGNIPHEESVLGSTHEEQHLTPLPSRHGGTESSTLTEENPYAVFRPLASNPPESHHPLAHITSFRTVERVLFKPVYSPPAPENIAVNASALPSSLGSAGDVPTQSQSSCGDLPAASTCRAQGGCSRRVDYDRCVRCIVQRRKCDSVKPQCGNCEKLGPGASCRWPKGRPTRNELLRQLEQVNLRDSVNANNGAPLNGQPGDTSMSTNNNNDATTGQSARAATGIVTGVGNNESQVDVTQVDSNGMLKHRDSFADYAKEEQKEIQEIFKSFSRDAVSQGEDGHPTEVGDTFSRSGSLCDTDINNNPGWSIGDPALPLDDDHWGCPIDVADGVPLTRMEHRAESFDSDPDIFTERDAEKWLAYTDMTADGFVLVNKTPPFLPTLDRLPPPVPHSSPVIPWSASARASSSALQAFAAHGSFISISRNFIQDEQPDDDPVDWAAWLNDNEENEDPS